MFYRFILFCSLVFPCGLVSGQEWEELGPALGNLEDFAVSISDPDRAYGIINRTRVVRSLDGGQSWEFTDSGLQEVTGLISITVDPTDGQTVYLGVAPAFGADYQEPPIWKSTDGGDSWQPLTEGLPYGKWGDSLYWSIKQILIHPEDPQYLVADTGVAYLYRSNDGGEQWEFIRRNSEYGCKFINPALNWKRPNVLWLLERCRPSRLDQVEPAGAVEELRLWKGIQRGASWSEESRFTVPYLPQQFLVDRQNPSTFYIETTSEEVWVSRDEGQTWERMELENFIEGEFYTIALSQPEGDPARLFLQVDGRNLYQSTDQGRSWILHSHPSHFYYNENRTFILSLDGKDLVSDGSRSRDGGQSWEAVWPGLRNVREIFPLQPGLEELYVASFRAIALGQTKGQTWNLKGDFERCRLNIPEPENLYADASRVLVITYRACLLESQDRGKSWTLLPTPDWGNRILESWRHPQEVQELFVITEGSDSETFGFWSSDAGRSWTELANLPFHTTELFYRKQEPQIWYANGRNPETYSSAVFRSKDGGESWELQETSELEALLALSPHEPGVMYAFQPRRRPFRTVDGGKSWQEIIPPEGRFIQEIVPHPTQPGRIFIPGSPVYQSFDRGLTWQQVGKTTAIEGYGQLFLSTFSHLPERLFAFNDERLYTLDIGVEPPVVPGFGVGALLITLLCMSLALFRGG